MKFTNETLPFSNWNSQYSALDISYNMDSRALMFSMAKTGLPSFTPALLADIDGFQKRLQQFIANLGKAQSDNPVRFLVHASSYQGIFNLGGDLGFFVECIRNNDRETLDAYAQLSIEVLFRNYHNLDCDLTTIALLEGTTIGAGFEAALSSDIIIAERGIEIGFPEVVFNMFPGMGAYSFLSRRLPPAQVERMIVSGEMHKAEDLYEQGVVDVLAEPGEGHQALQQFMDKHHRSSTTRKAVLQMRERLNPLEFRELKDIVDMWVDSAMALESKNLKIMERLVKAQLRRVDRTQVGKHAVS